MSPEYFREGLFSAKSDVFSFGVLMLEIICGRKNNSFHHDSEGPLNLIVHVKSQASSSCFIDSIFGPF